jgi:chaperonin GroEL (HSP60 family)
LFLTKLNYCIFIVVVKVGDGTTTVVLLAAEFLREAKPFIEDGVHSQNLIRSYRTACTLVHTYISSS